MRLEHLYAADLSLLVVLQVLLEERSVTRAARRLGRSQPAISRSLGRLRELFDDPLFVRDGAGLEPTARVLELAEPLRRALAVVDREVLAPTGFDPRTDRRQLEILAVDFAEAMLLPGPLARLAAEAPLIDVVVGAAPTGWSVADALRGGVDLALSPLSGEDAQIRAASVGRETFACLVRKGHPVLERGLDLQTYVELAHVLVAPGGTPGGVVDRELERRGLSRRVAVRTRRFLTAPGLVARTDLIVTVPRRFAVWVAYRLDVVVLEPPLELPGFDMKLAWHERQHRDPGHRWVRERFVEEVRRELALPPSPTG